ncbi:MAG: energy transducer TonB [Thermomonas sp.]|uniref:energy transducer TonB n=1 Tax=Thermomonas sp. TaxID=1971895 RepID=UPI001B4A3FA0|nr:energy transducer TonB [Thermomonas sp.]MBK6333013.1 energy transducer TonB [Thermomonas sp.]MBK6417525.1 energy transducer TonB [Thermomonas sp.]MBP9696327.1 energy transducer TonB [Thermomonas sp.]
MPDPTPRRARLLPPHIAKPLAIAFGIGLLLFLLLWLDQRNDSDFFKAGTPASGTNGDPEALPAPVPADIASEDRGASGLGLPPGDTRPAPRTSEAPRIIEPPAPPPAPPAPTAPAPIADSGAPVPVSRPPPRYPPEALRRNIGGSVRVQATVAADGSVERLDLAQSSGNRDLDRAALEAVRRWRFQPAQRNGQPVSATVIIPLEFNPGG